jgi:hypothetical protein
MAWLGNSLAISSCSTGTTLKEGEFRGTMVVLSMAEAAGMLTEKSMLALLLSSILQKSNLQGKST